MLLTVLGLGDNEWHLFRSKSLRGAALRRIKAKLSDGGGRPTISFHRRRGRRHNDSRRAKRARVCVCLATSRLEVLMGDDNDDDDTHVLASQLRNKGLPGLNYTHKHEYFNQTSQSTRRGNILPSRFRPTS